MSIVKQNQELTFIFSLENALIAEMKKTERIYLDHASTTPVLPEVVKAMAPYFSKQFYNPSALYKEGVLVARALKEARGEVARTLSALPDEIVFTGSGTESDNLAILGVVKASIRVVKKPHVIISAIEHPAIMELVPEIKRLGGEVTVVPVDADGLVSPSSIQKALKSSTVLVSIMYANNEVGTIQPIKEIAKTIRHSKKSKNSKLTTNNYPYFHTDASQAANYCNVNVLQLGIDLMTLDGSKIYGPKGIGMLWVKRDTPIESIIFGGGQENGLRSGTENIPYIIGFAKALSIVSKSAESESKRLSKLRDSAIRAILKNHGGAVLNGSSTERLPNNINICFKGIDAEFAVLKADALGILCSGASSCRTLSENSRSYVLEAMQKDGMNDCADSSLRFSLGRNTTTHDIRTLIKALPKIIKNS